jgi:hypothetical protein
VIQPLASPEKEAKTGIARVQHRQRIAQPANRLELLILRRSGSLASDSPDERAPVLEYANLGGVGVGNVDVTRLISEDARNASELIVRRQLGSAR